MLADMAMGIEAARLLTYKSAALIDGGQPNTMFASMAKCFAADHCKKVVADAVQIFGGAGFNTECVITLCVKLIISFALDQICPTSAWI